MEVLPKNLIKLLPEKRRFILFAPVHKIPEQIFIRVVFVECCCIGNFSRNIRFDVDIKIEITIQFIKKAMHMNNYSVKLELKQNVVYFCVSHASVIRVEANQRKKNADQLN